MTWIDWWQKGASTNNLRAAATGIGIDTTCVQQHAAPARCLLLKLQRRKHDDENDNYALDTQQESLLCARFCFCQHGALPAVRSGA